MQSEGNGRHLLLLLVIPMLVPIPRLSVTNPCSIFPWLGRAEMGAVFIIKTLLSDDQNLIVPPSRGSLVTERPLQISHYCHMSHYTHDRHGSDVFDKVLPQGPLYCTYHSKYRQTFLLYLSVAYTQTNQIKSDISDSQMMAAWSLIKQLHHVQ